MRISKESPLRRLPSALNIRQTLFLDAIRYSAEMSFIAYSRLQEALLSLPYRDIIKNSTLEIQSESIMLNAWSIIDSVYRLRILLEQFPHLKQKSSGLILFYQSTSRVENLRHSIQHINREIDSLVKNKIPVLGTLSWVYSTEPDKKMYLCNLQPGTIFSRTVPFGRVPKKVQIPLDNICINHQEKVCLNEVISQTGKLITMLEKNLATQIEHLPQAGADVLMVLELEPIKNE